MVLKSLLIIPSALVGSAFLIRKKTSSSWINLKNHADTMPSNLNGKVILITGGNTGLGFHLARDLAKRRGTVVLACRNVEKATDALEQITKETGNENVDCLPLDLGNLKSIDSFCTLFTEKYPKVYAVVCNAGVFVSMDEKRKTSDKFEAHFGINHLGHFALVNNLIPHLKKSGMQSRFVFVSSNLMSKGKIDVKKRDFVYDGRIEDPSKGEKKSFTPTGYCDSKLMNALTCKHLANSPVTKGSNLSFFSVCPGWCSSDLGRDMNFGWGKKLLVFPITFMFQRSPQQGAQNLLQVTIEDENVLENGGFYRDGKVSEKETEYLNQLIADDVDKELWDISQKLVTDRKD